MTAEIPPFAANKALSDLKGLIEMHRDMISNNNFELPLSDMLYKEIPSLVEIEEIIKEAIESSNASRAILPALSIAEMIEVSDVASNNKFSTDNDFRQLVVKTKFNAAWILLIGDKENINLANRLIEQGFFIFSTVDIPLTKYIGSKETSLIHYLQFVVSYSKIYGCQAPGDPHRLSHYIEEEVPAAIVCSGKLTSIEEFLILGAIKLGIPTVVPESYQYNFENIYRSDNHQAIIDYILQLQNLRIKTYKDKSFILPEYCDKLFEHEPVKPVKWIGKTEDSFFLVKQGIGKKGIEIIGIPNEDGAVGVLVEVAHPRIDDVVTEYMESFVVKSLKYIHGVTAYQIDHQLHIGLDEGISLTPDVIAEAIREGLHFHFPELVDIAVKIIYDKNEIKKMLSEIINHRNIRSEHISALKEENIEDFYYCVGCSTFATDHFCVITPDRQPMCSRTWSQIKSRAILTKDDNEGAPRFFRSKKHPDIPSMGIIEKGECIDSEKGEYTGVNKAIESFTDGRVDRVFMHSIFDYPHTSCSCFSYLAFYIPEVDGIGIMHRNYNGKAPNGKDWDTLANSAAGGQHDGICGISAGYLKSPKFLQADGGFARVVWVTEVVFNIISKYLPPQIIVAVGDEVSDLNELKNYRQ